MKQSILLAIVIAALTGIGFVWYQYVRIIPVNPGDVEIAADPQLGELERLATIDLKTEILNDPFFQSLEPPPAPRGVTPKAGRPNPYLPF